MWATTIEGQNHCALRTKFHVSDSQNTRNHITSDRRSKRAWSYCVLCIPFILSGSPNQCWLHTCDACLITTWRLGLRAPLVARNKFVLFVGLAFCSQIRTVILERQFCKGAKLCAAPISKVESHVWISVYTMLDGFSAIRCEYSLRFCFEARLSAKPSIWKWSCTLESSFSQERVSI